MKKIQNIFSIIFVFTLLFSSCSEIDPKIDDFESDKVAFKYAVDGDYELDFFIGSTITFENTSVASGNCVWDFGDNIGQSTNTNPTYIYEEPGLYNVTLTIEGVGKTTKTILISDILPVVSFKSTSQTPVIKTSEITLDAFIPNPKELPIDYLWIFPEGTIGEDGAVIATSKNQDPGVLKFNNVGSQQIVLKTVLGGRDLEEVVINVNVGYDKPAKTIYYAVKGGNMMALKLIADLPSDVKNKPLNLGLKSGQHPFNIIFADTSLYVLDAGRQFYFIDDQFGNLGDGRITVLSKDGKSQDVMVNNNGGKAFDDPYFGYIADGVLHFSDRNTGISQVATSARNMSGARATVVPFWVQNDKLGYYNKGIGYGAINGGFTKYNGVWWWSKTFGGTPAVYRFVESDVKDKPTELPASGLVLSGEAVKSFVIDGTRGMFYCAIINKGVYRIPLADLAAKVELKSDYLIMALPTDTESTESERIYISQLTLDPDDGCVYFGYRAGEGATEKSGLKRYNPNNPKKLDTLVENVEIYGVTINNTKSQLF